MNNKRLLGLMAVSILSLGAISFSASAEFHDAKNQHENYFSENVSLALDWSVPLNSINKGTDMARINPLAQRQKERAAQHQASLDKGGPASEKTSRGISKINVASGTKQVVLETYQAQMSVDLARIKEVKNIDDKARLKTEFLETYKPFVKQYVEQNHKYPNDVLVQNMIWLFDTGNTVDGLMLGIFLSQQDCHVMPKSFNRDMQTFICDEVYDAFIKQVKDAKFDDDTRSLISHVLNTIENDKWSLSPPVHSKMYALAAKVAKGLERWPDCQKYCEQAVEVNPDGHGVKTLLAEATEKALHAGAGGETSA